MSIAARVLALAFALTVLLVVCSIGADEGQISIPTSVQPNDVRSYKVLVDIRGKMPVRNSTEPLDLNARYTLTLRHKYGRREGDGLMPLEVSVTEGMLTSNGQNLSVTSSMFPNITYLLQRDWQPSRVFGVRGTRYQNSIPGFNYVNMIVLFYLYGGDTPHAVGEKWNAQAKLPFYNETYSFTNTLVKAPEKIDSIDCAVVRQELSWAVSGQATTPPASVTATADSSFAIADGKLVKSHAESAIVFKQASAGDASGQEPKTSRANISIDISLIE